MVPIEMSLQALDPKGEVPRTLKAGDLTVVDGDQTRPVTDLAPLSKPWRIVVYVDRVLTGSRTLRTAAGSLAERAAVLAALGPVEVVVAEPVPRVVLSATQDVHAIDEALSKLWLVGDGRDDVRILRQRFRDQKKDEATSADPVGEALEQEERLVRRQQEALAEWLVMQEGGGPRALMLVSDGFDVDPEKYYRPDSVPAGEAGTTAAASPASEGAL
jgi:hypothetical protein